MAETPVGGLKPPGSPSNPGASTDQNRTQNPAAVGVTAPSPFLTPPLDDFWAHQVAEKAKAKVLGYFAIATVLIAAVSFLYGKETIDRAVEAEVKAAVTAKSPLIDQQIDSLMEPEKDKIAILERKVTELSEVIDQYRKNTESQYSAFATLIVGSRQQVSALVSSLSTHDAPIAAVVQGTIDLSSSIGNIFHVDSSPAGEGGPALYAITSILSKSGRHIELSVEGAFYGAGGSEFGIVAVQLFDYLKSNGAYRSSDWPRGVKTKPASARPVVRITGYTNAQGADVDTITRQLKAGNVIIAEMEIDDGLLAYKYGIYDAAKGAARGAHMMAVVGYDEPTGSVKLANTWGDNWGEGGFIRLSTKAFLDRAARIYWISGVMEL
jgi:hypothetical protein